MITYKKSNVFTDKELWKEVQYFINDSDLIIKPIINIEDAQKEIDIRIKVFMEEQGFSYESEFDKEEAISVGFLLYKDKELVGTFSYAYRGNNIIFYRRLAILPNFRKLGYGKKVFAFMEEHLKQKYKPLIITFNGEKYLESYWIKLGYQIIEETSEGPTCPPLLICQKIIK